MSDMVLEMAVLCRTWICMWSTTNACNRMHRGVVDKPSHGDGLDQDQRRRRKKSIDDLPLLLAPPEKWTRGNKARTRRAQISNRGKNKTSTPRCTFRAGKDKRSTSRAAASFPLLLQQD